MHVELDDETARLAEDEASISEGGDVTALVHEAVASYVERQRVLRELVANPPGAPAGDAAAAVAPVIDAAALAAVAAKYDLDLGAVKAGKAPVPKEVEDLLRSVDAKPGDLGDVLDVILGGVVRVPPVRPPQPVDDEAVAIALAKSSVSSEDIAATVERMLGLAKRVDQLRSGTDHPSG